MTTFSLTSLGCKVNQYEAAAVAARLVAGGLRRACEGDPAGVVVIHTCCVTSVAMRKSRNAIRRAIKNSPQATVFVVGCYSDYHAAAVGELVAAMNVPPQRVHLAGHHQDLAAGVDRLLLSLSATEGSPGRREPLGAGVPENIRARRQAAVAAKAPGADGLAALDHFPGHQRAFVKVQDGCDAFCAYCIIPYTRPRVRSRDADEIVAECRRLVDAGHRELVLSGVFLGAFGRQTTVRKRWGAQAAALPGLVRRVAGIPGLWRVRLSSIEPADLDAALLDVCRSVRQVAPHLHLALQSGSAAVLKRMNRQYTPDDFRRTVDRLAEAIDRPAISTDIIVGFPGETDADFEATLEMCRHAGFVRVHAFPFSAIQGTAAYAYRREAPPRKVVKDRLARIKAVTDVTARQFRARFVGETLEALVEDHPTRSGHQAMTDRYMTVGFEEEARPGQVVSVHVDAVTQDGLSGHLS